MPFDLDDDEYRATRILTGADKPDEIWKDIKGYEGLYQVSNLGRIKSLRCWTGSMYIDKPKILKGSKTKYGYVHLIINKKHFCVHRLVAEAFIPNENNLPVINHINRYKRRQ